MADTGVGRYISPEIRDARYRQLGEPGVVKGWSMPARASEGGGPGTTWRAGVVQPSRETAGGADVVSSGEVLWRFEREPRLWKRRHGHRDACSKGGRRLSVVAFVCKWEVELYSGQALDGARQAAASLTT